MGRRCMVCDRGPECQPRWLYVVGRPDGGLVKLGCTVNVSRRVYQLRRWVAEPRLEVFAKAPAGCEYLASRRESKALRRLERFRVRGDWFDCPAAVAIEAMEAACHG